MEVDGDDFLELRLEEHDLIDDIEMSDDELNQEIEMLNKREKTETHNMKRETNTKEGQCLENENDQKIAWKESNVDHRAPQNQIDVNSRKVGDQATNKNNFKEKEPYNNGFCNIQFDKKRLFKPLHVDKNTDPLVVGREISYRLQEKKTILIKNVVRVIGISMSVEVFNETKKIMKSGGLKTDDGQRKRSPGGTFLYILKNRGYASNAQMKEIFKYENERNKEKRKHKAQKLRNNDRKTAKIGNGDGKIEDKS